MTIMTLLHTPNNKVIKVIIGSTGRRAERELAEIFQGYGYDVRPGVAVSFGTEPDLVGLKGVHCELKRREHVDLSAALKQAAADAEKFKDGVPCVFHRGNRQSWRVTMTLENWMKLYKCYVK